MADCYLPGLVLRSEQKGRLKFMIYRAKITLEVVTTRQMPLYLQLLVQEKC